MVVVSAGTATLDWRSAKSKCRFLKSFAPEQLWPRAEPNVTPWRKCGYDLIVKVLQHRDSVRRNQAFLLLQLKASFHIGALSYLSSLPEKLLSLLFLIELYGSWEGHRRNKLSCFLQDHKLVIGPSLLWDKVLFFWMRSDKNNQKKTWLLRKLDYYARNMHKQGLCPGWAPAAQFSSWPDSYH